MFCSVCPPYLQVSYPEIMTLLAASPLVHPRTRIIIEYPQSHSHDMSATLGPLHQVRNRKYGRTYVAIYGPASDLQRVGQADYSVAL